MINQPGASIPQDLMAEAARRLAGAVKMLERQQQREQNEDDDGTGGYEADLAMEVIEDVTKTLLAAAKQP